MEPPAAVAENRHSGLPGRAAGYSCRQSGFPDRHLRLDGRPRQTAADQGRTETVDDSTAAARPRGHRHLCRPGIDDTGLDLRRPRSEEHTSELQSLMRISYAVFCLKKKTTPQPT